MKQSYVVDAPAQKLFEKLTKADFWPDNQYSSRTKPMFWKDSILENLMTINGSVTGPYGASLTVNFQIQTSAGNKSRISVSASGSKDSYVSAHEFISSVGEWVNALLAERESEAGSSANDVAEPYENQSSLDLQDAVTRHRELGKGYSFPYSFDSAWKCKPDFLVDNAFISCLQVHFGFGLSEDWINALEEIALINRLLLEAPREYRFKFSNEERYWLLGLILHLGLDQIVCNHVNPFGRCGIRELQELGVSGQYPVIRNYAFTEVEDPDEYSPLGKYVRQAIEAVLEETVQEDHELFLEDANERSMTHVLAKRLELWFPGFSVDCEYNRDGIDPKSLNLGDACTLASGPESIEQEDSECRSVYPDIIVHKRGASENLVVIEAKKSAVKHNCHDKAKLHGYKKQLGFQLGFQVILPVGDEYNHYLQVYDWGTWEWGIIPVADIECNCNFS